MGWQHHFEDSLERIEDAGLPKRLVRRLLFDSKLTIGSRVLVVGLHDVRLPRILDGLGIDVVGLDDRDDVLEIAGRSVSNIDLVRLPESGPLPFPSFSFDSVFVRGCRVYGEGLDTERSTRLTGELAALLRPAGELAFLDPTPDDLRTAALFQHLECLPGDLRTERFATGWSMRNAIALTTLRIPSEPMERDAWKRLVESSPTVEPQIERDAA